ncbi:hypothetical protein GF343_00320 [Candidatus Woesearchaeota archaeon]|nr:hypothetical protein [Candidatus Woesearchaeota archaeon]
MKFKILFVVFVVVLLSASVIADEPKVKVSHADKRRALIKQTAGEYTKAEQYLTTAAGLSALPLGMGGVASGAFLAAGTALKGKAEAGKAQLAKMRTNIYARGWYSVYDVIDAYEDYSGINQYSALFFGEEWLAKRRKMAAEYFCEKTLLLGGKQCWQSKICEGFYNSKEPPVGRSVLVAQSGIGGYEPAVSIQGERSLPITYKEGGKSKRRYVYKLTYFISNPHDRALTYSIKLAGPVKEFTSPGMTLQPATEDKVFRDERLGNNPLITESDNYYETVCLAFSPRMVAASGRMIGARRVSEMCAPLVSYDGAATRPYTEVAEEDLPGGQAEAGERAEVESNPLENA